MHFIRKKDESNETQNIINRPSGNQELLDIIEKGDYEKALDILEYFEENEMFDLENEYNYAVIQWNPKNVKTNFYVIGLTNNTMTIHQIHLKKNLLPY